MPEKTILDENIAEQLTFDCNGANLVKLGFTLSLEHNPVQSKFTLFLEHR